MILLFVVRLRANRLMWKRRSSGGSGQNVYTAENFQPAATAAQATAGSVYRLIGGASSVLRLFFLMSETSRGARTHTDQSVVACTQRPYVPTDKTLAAWRCAYTKTVIN